LRTLRVRASAPLPSRVRPPQFRLRIGDDGRVLEGVVTSSSGAPELDEELLRQALDALWEPASLDGRPVEVWFARGRAELVRN
jgi:hypothetical protein